MPTTYADALGDIFADSQTESDQHLRVGVLG